MAIETDSHETLVQEYVEWVNGDAERVGVMEESIDVYNPGLPDGEVHRREEYAAYLQKIRGGFPDAHFTVDDVVADDDTVFLEFTITGTQTGEFQGLPATDREIAIRGAEKFLVSDDRIQEIHAFYDTQEIPDQLGLTFPSVVPQLPKLVVRKFT